MRCSATSAAATVFHTTPRVREHGVMASVSDIVKTDTKTVNVEEQPVLGTEQTAADRMDDAFAACSR